MVNLRHYQESGIRKVAIKLATGIRKVVFQLATGGGKTIIFSAIANRYTTKSERNVLILVHRKELATQTRSTLYSAFEISAQPIIAGMKYIPPARVYVGMVESVNRRIEKIIKELNIGLLIIDECHIGSFNKIHQHFPKEFIVGVTATPITSSKKKPLKLYYDDIVCGVDIPDLISEGFLAQNITFAPKDSVDRATLAVANTGDFDEGLMAMQFSKPRYINNTVEAYKKYCEHTKTIVFNVTMAHSREVCAAFVEAGYNARALDMQCTDEERDEILRWYKDTPDAILCNVGIATTGFDEPTIQSVIVNRATMSLALWLQMTGRGGRPIDENWILEKGVQYPYTVSAKKDFTIVDMGGNAITHGDWNNSRNWEDIFFNPPEPGKSSVPPTKSCPECDAIIPAGSMTCKYCGYQFPPKERELEEKLDEFIVVTKGIDVERIMEENKQRKEFFPFFEIGRKLSVDAKNTIPQMTDEFAEFILSKYNELGRDWLKRKNQANSTNKRYNAWYQETAQDHLYNELKKQFPKWNYQPQVKSASTPA